MYPGGLSVWNIYLDWRWLVLRDEFFKIWHRVLSLKSTDVGLLRGYVMLYFRRLHCLQTHHHENLKSHTDEFLFNNFVAIFCMCVCDKHLTLISLQYLKFYMTILVNISPFLWVLTCYVRASMSVGDGQSSTVVYYKEIPTYCVSRLSIFDLETTRGWNCCYLFHISHWYPFCKSYVTVKVTT
jgi:hypothetical protein